MQFIKYLKYRLSNIIKHNRALIGLGNLILLRKNYSNIKYLADSEMKIFSQSGEDGIIDFILNRINKKKDIKFIEIGTSDYEEANTRYIAESRPCTGLLIDLSNEINFVKKRNFYWQNQIYIENSRVSPENINLILEKHDFLDNFDFLSLDIDGLDYWVLEKINLTNASLVVCEYNPLFGSEYSLTIPNTENFNREEYSKLYFGASLKAFIKLMKKKGFIFLGSNSFCNNAFFVNTKYSKQFDDLIIENLSNYVDFKFREIILNNKKNFKEKLIKKIKDYELLNLDNNRLSSIGELFKINDK
jgi:hypothetical protein